VSRTHEERVALASRAVALRETGATAREIAASLGVSRSYASALYTDPDGSRDKKRRARYYLACPVCGGRMGSAQLWGAGKAPERCYGCRKAFEREQKVWTRERVVDAIRRFAAENGRPPVSTEWSHSDRGDGYPALTSVYQNSASPNAPFRSWADAIEAAGFDRPRVGGYRRSEETLRRLSESLTYWTQERLTGRILVYAAEHGRMPTQADFAADATLPDYKTFWEKTGGIRVFARRYGLATAPRRPRSVAA
jgi:hypothetical protein